VSGQVGTKPLRHFGTKFKPKSVAEVSEHFGTKELDTSAPHRITKIALVLLAYNYQSRRKEGEGGQAPPAALSMERHFEEDEKFSAYVQSFKCFTAPSKLSWCRSVPFFRDLVPKCLCLLSFNPWAEPSSDKANNGINVLLLLQTIELYYHNKTLLGWQVSFQM